MTVLHDRVQATILLLRTYELARPDISVAHPVPTPSGFAAPVRCRTCKGTGRMIGPRDERHACNRCKRQVERPHGCVPCLECTEGLVHQDAYLTPKGKAELGVTGTTRSMTRDESRRAEQNAARDLALRLGHVDEAYASITPERAALEDALAAHGCSVAPGQVTIWLAGDYPALDRALELTAVRMPSLVARVRLAFLGDLDSSRYTRLDPHARSNADKGVRYVTANMPAGPITVPYWAVVKAGQAKGKTIEERLAEGWKLSRVAREFNLSEQRVKEIARRWRDKQQPQEVAA